MTSQLHEVLTVGQIAALAPIVGELIAALAKLAAITELVRPAADEDSARSRDEIIDDIWRIVGMPS